MIIRYDKQAKALSVQLVPSDPSEYSHTDEITDMLFIDRNKDGEAISVEILGIDCIEDYDGKKFQVGGTK